MKMDELLILLLFLSFIHFVQFFFVKKNQFNLIFKTNNNNNNNNKLEFQKINK